MPARLGQSKRFPQYLSVIICLNFDSFKFQDYVFPYHNKGKLISHHMKKVLIFVVCYHADKFINGLLKRIPAEIWDTAKYDTEILIIDDHSTDNTFYTAHEYIMQAGLRRFTLLSNPVNQGYGGNQKIGYHYAIQYGFDVVLLLHGDGQYPPEYIVPMISPILNGEADVVLGSRMLKKTDALKGGMPFYKWIGNQILTGLQNTMLGTHLSEFHSGYRAYSVAALAKVPFDLNSNYFDFDTEIIVQLLDTGQRFREIPIPTFYGDEISRVNGIKYAALILRTTLLSRIVRLGIFYDPRFYYQAGNTEYFSKFGYPSSHQFALDHLNKGATVLDMGCGPGLMANELNRFGIKTISIDTAIHPMARNASIEAIEANIETYDFTTFTRKVDAILLLDIIEHLKSPESLLNRIREAFSAQAPLVIITTGNISFFIIRLALLFGMFNYGRRGILDLDHTRLFTFASLKRLVQSHGYEVLEVKGIPVPFPLAMGNTRFARLILNINRVLIFLSKKLFSYQIAMTVRPKPTLKQLLSDARSKRELLLVQLAKNGKSP